MSKTRHRRIFRPVLPARLLALGLAVSLCLGQAPVTWANDIQVDGSTRSRIYNIQAGQAVFSADGTQVLNGPSQTATTSSNVVITTGTRNGNNAFNSFSTFNIPAGKSVNLILPTGTNTLINRVTGNASSTIAGQLESNMFDITGNRIVGGNVILMNPNGVLFSSTARVNVGALTATSATGLRFGDGIMGAKATQDLEQAPFSGALQRFIFNLSNNQRPTGIRALTGSQINALGDINFLGGSVLSQGVLNSGGRINLVAAEVLNSQGQRQAFEVDLAQLASRLDAGAIAGSVTGAAALRTLHNQLRRDVLDYGLIVAGDLPEATRMTLTGNKLLLSTDSNVVVSSTVNTHTLMASQTGNVVMTGLRANLDGIGGVTSGLVDGADGRNLTAYSGSGAVQSFHGIIRNRGGDSLLGQAMGRGGNGGNVVFSGRTVSVMNTVVQGDGGRTLANGLGGRGGNMLVAANEDISLSEVGRNSFQMSGGDGGMKHGLGGRIFMAANDILGQGSGHLIYAMGSGELATGENSTYQRIEFNANNTIRLGRPTDGYWSYQIRTRGITPGNSTQTATTLGDGNDIDLSANNIELNAVLLDTGGASALPSSNKAGGAGGTQRITANTTTLYKTQLYSLGGQTYSTAARGFAAYEENGPGIQVIGQDRLTLTDTDIMTPGGWSVSGAAKGGSVRLSGRHIVADDLFVTTNGGQGNSVGTHTGHGSDGGSITIDSYDTLSLNDSRLWAQGWGGAHGSVLSNGTIVGPGNGGNGGVIRLVPTAGLASATTTILNTQIKADGGQAGSMRNTAFDRSVGNLANGGTGGRGGIIQIGQPGGPLSAQRGTVILGAETEKLTLLDASGGNGGAGGTLFNATEAGTRTAASNGGLGGAGGTIGINGNVVTLNPRTELYAEGGRGGNGGAISGTIPIERERNQPRQYTAGLGGDGGAGGSIALNANSQLTLNADTLGPASPSLSRADFDTLFAAGRQGQRNMLESLEDSVKSVVVSASGGNGGLGGTLQQQGQVKNKNFASLNGNTGGNGGAGGQVSLQAQGAVTIESVVRDNADGSVSGSVAIVRTLGGKGGNGSDIANDVQKTWLARTGNGGRGGSGGSINMGTQQGPAVLQGWLVSDGGHGGEAGGFVEDTQAGGNGNHLGSLQVGRGGNGGNGGQIRVSTVQGSLQFGGADLTGSAGNASNTRPMSLITVNGGEGGTSPLFPGSPQQAARQGYAGKGGQGGSIIISNTTQSLSRGIEINDNQLFSARGGNGGNLNLTPLSGTPWQQVSQSLMGVQRNSTLNGTQSLWLGGTNQNFSLIENTNGPVSGSPDTTVRSSISVVAGEGYSSDEGTTQGQGGTIRFEAAAP